MRHKADTTNGSCCPPVRRRSQPGEDIGLHLANYPCIHGRNATHGADPGPQWTRGTPSGQPPESGADHADGADSAGGRAGQGCPSGEPGIRKSSDDNYKWLIKASAEGYKWAIPAGNNFTATDKPAGTPEAKPEEGKKSTSYYRPSNSYATNPDSDPPRYVRRLSETGIEAFKDINWLDIGFEFRTRYEMRHDDFRRVEAGFDNPFFLRSRAYVGIREILDPFRFAVEFQDSRVYNNRFPTTDQENNPYDLIQGYGELNFKNALGAGRSQAEPSSQVSGRAHGLRNAGPAVYRAKRMA